MARAARLRQFQLGHDLTEFRIVTRFHLEPKKAWATSRVSRINDKRHYRAFRKPIQLIPRANFADRAWLALQVVHRRSMEALLERLLTEVPCEETTPATATT